MSLPPIIYHVFSRPLPYLPTLLLQQKIHELQLQKRRETAGSHPDVLLLLEHRPVYTAGRRQAEKEMPEDAARLRGLGADFVSTQRGGQITYHGPGQIVGYPLLDLGRMRLSIRDYICKLQTTMKHHLLENYNVTSVESDNTGVFLSTHRKVASIGVQVRHRLTSHGFAYNVTREPLAWFMQVLACGLADVKAACISEAAGQDVTIQHDLEKFILVFARVFGRQLIKIDGSKDSQIIDMIGELEEEAVARGHWPHYPDGPRVT